MTKHINFDNYEQVSAQGTAYTEGLMRVWEKLGRPEDLDTNTGWLMMDQIIAVWQKCFRQEVLDWDHDRRVDLSSERSVKEHVKGGGYNPIAYPPILFALIKAIFPDINLSTRKIQKTLTDRYPLFKTTNLNI